MVTPISAGRIGSRYAHDVVITVEGSGLGISPSDMSRIAVTVADRRFRWRYPMRFGDRGCGGRTRRFFEIPKSRSGKNRTAQSPTNLRASGAVAHD